MRQQVPFVLALVAAAASSVVAQEPAKGPKVAVVSLQRVFRDSLMGKGYSAQLDALQKDLDSRVAKSQAEVQKLDLAMKAIQDEVEKQGAVLSEDARQQKQVELTRKGRERQAFVEDAQAELQRVRERAEQQAGNLRNEFQVKVKPFLEAVSKEKAIDILLEEQATVSVLGKGSDLTAAVVAKADEAEKTAKGPAAPKPTPPAAPKPTPATPPKP
jgi:outer membrane protein